MQPLPFENVKFNIPEADIIFGETVEAENIGLYLRGILAPERERKGFVETALVAPPFTYLERGVVTEVIHNERGFSGKIKVSFTNPLLGSDVVHWGGDVGSTPLEGMDVWAMRDNMGNIVAVASFPKKDSSWGVNSSPTIQSTGYEEGDRVFQALYKQEGEDGKFLGHTPSSQIIQRGRTGETVVSDLTHNTSLRLGGNCKISDEEYISLQFDSPKCKVTVSSTGNTDITGIKRLLLSVMDSICSFFASLMLVGKQVFISGGTSVTIVGGKVDVISSNVSIGSGGDMYPVALATGEKDVSLVVGAGEIGVNLQTGYVKPGTYKVGVINSKSSVLKAKL